ncbi:Hydrogen peroxide-inducible genes activator [Paraburkholderia domus]|nr:Hydrogen peroxide-inducible genes activator [Paraburkholderia domus]
MAMDIRQLRTLVAVADGGSFSAAADRLFMTQSAVSMQMKALEEHLGATLFDRTCRPPMLNSRGLFFVQHARSVIDGFDALAKIAKTREGTLVGTVRVGVIPSVATSLLPPALLRLRQVYPSLLVKIVSGLSPELAFKVQQRDLDVAIVTEPERIDVTSVFDPIRIEELKLVVHRELVHGSVREMLERYRFIRFNATMGVGRIVDAALRSMNVATNDVMELDSIELIARFVGMKLGITIIPSCCVPPDLSTALSEFSLEPAVHRRVGFVTRRGNLDAPNVQAVAEMFRAIGEGEIAHT